MLRLMPSLNEKELWVGFARDALSGYVASGDIDDNEELVDDMVEVASDYADAMLDEVNERFGSKTASGRRRRKKIADEED